MDKKERLFELINQYRKTELLYTVLKIIPSVIFILLGPVASLFLIFDRKIFEPLVLLMALIIVILALPGLLKDYKKYRSPESCRLRHSILYPESVTEIIIYPDKIFLDIKGSENYEIRLREGEIREEMIDLFKEYFGEERVVTLKGKENH